jgi:hypothetical protein
MTNDLKERIRTALAGAEKDPQNSARVLLGYLPADKPEDRADVLEALCNVSAWSNLDEEAREHVGLSWSMTRTYAEELLTIRRDVVGLGYALMACHKLGDAVAAEAYRRELNYPAIADPKALSVDEKAEFEAWWAKNGSPRR